MRSRSQPTTIFVHGAGGGGWEWTIWERVFAAHGASVLSPDLLPARGGLLATHIEDYAGQVVEWCAGAQRPLLLVGASLGGLLALMIAPLVAPAAIVLVNPLPPIGITPRLAPRDHVDIVPWGTGRSLRGTRHTLPDADDAACLFAFRRWRDESGAVLRAASDGITVETPRCPVLILASEHDHDLPPSSGRALADHLGAQFRVITGASHVGPLLGRHAAQIAEQVWQWSRTRAGPAS
jgi:pimeloyl-ACP methyl ester carboxylesterase